MKTETKLIHISNDDGISYEVAIKNPGIYKYVGLGYDYLIVPDCKESYPIVIGINTLNDTVFDPTKNSSTFRFKKITGKEIVLTFKD